jgi:phosphoglucomutase
LCARTDSFFVSTHRYLGNEALELEEQGYSPQFAYEEAIGYMNGTNIKDKDGVTALAIFCEMATVLASEGKTVSQHLDFLYQESVLIPAHVVK